MIRIASSSVPSAKFVLHDIRTFDYGHNQWDAMVASFCLPFLYDEEAAKLITEMSHGLKKGGLLYLSTMKGSGHKWETTSFSGSKAIFFNYYSPEFLNAQFAANGLKVVEEIFQNYEIYGSAPLVDMIYLLDKQ